MRKWTAEVSVAGQDATCLIEYTNDTLEDTKKAAIKVAVEVIKNEFASDASVVLFKQLTNDDAPKRDRSFYVYRDDDGKIKTQYMGA